MAIEKFRFVSPGVQIKEIDQSVLAPAEPVIGPVVVGKFLKGPAFIPTTIKSIDEFRDEEPSETRYEAERKAFERVGYEKISA